MSRYVVRLGTSSGEIQEKELTAESTERLKRDLVDQGYQVLEVKPVGLLTGGRSFSFGKRVGDAEFLLFNQQLAALLRAGLPVLSGLLLLAERRANQTFRTILNEIVEDVRSGQSLSEAFATRGEVFPPMYPATLASGEKSGDLGEVLTRYVKYSKQAYALKKKMVSAMVYPAVLVALSVGLVIFLLTYVLPSFEGFFADLSGELPWLTQTVVKVSNFVTQNLPFIGAGLILGISFYIVSRRTLEGRLATDRFKLGLPVFGELIRKFHVSQISRTLGTLLASGTTAIQALEVTSQSTGNEVLREALLSIRGKILEGGSMWESMDATGEFPDMAVEMTKVGESTGALAQMFSNIAEFYEQEVEESVARYVALLEPILLVTMGLIIATLVLAVYLPMFSAFSQIGDQ